METPAPPAPAAGAEDFRLAALGYAREALGILATLARQATSEAVRVSAANALIDRAYGRPAQAVKMGGEGGADDGQGVSVTFQWQDQDTAKC